MNLILALEKFSIPHFCRRGRRLHFSTWILALCALFLLSSCNSKKYLREDQSFLFDNKIVIKSEDKVDDKAGLKYKLSTIYRQPETKGVIPRHIFYYQYQERLRKDSLKRIEYLSKGLGEPKTRKKWSEEKLIRNRPVIFDTIKAEHTTEDFERYLNLRGYRYAEATYKWKTADKQTYVTYLVDPGPRIYIDTFNIATTDSFLRQIVDVNMYKSNFPPGSPLDIELYNLEKTRIAADFQNNGYARFDETYIAPLEVDTAGNYVRATMRILNENDSVFHKKYYVGNVTIYSDYSLSDTSRLYDTIVHGITYITPEPVQTLKPEAIERNIFLKTGEVTRKENVNQTLKNLSRMEIIKFVTPATVVDTISRDTMQLDTPRIHYLLYLNRNRKIGLNVFGELTYANLALTKRSLLGTSFSANYRDQNIFRGAEVLNLNFQTGVEFNFFNKDAIDTIGLINSFSIGGGPNITFPRFIDPLKLYSFVLGGSKRYEQPSDVKNRILRWLLFDATTRLNASYNWVDIKELYRYHQLNTGLSYDIIPDNFRKLTVERFGLDLFFPSPTITFKREVLDKSRLLSESFGKYLFTGLLFRSHQYEFQGPPRRKAGYFSLLHNSEISGLEAWVFNRVYNLIGNTRNEFTIGNENPNDSISNLVRFSHFIKGEIDVRYYYDISSAVQFAVRVNTGLATPFGQYSKQVPYTKQFFVGGPLSNRAWQIRELGPGSYRDNAQVSKFAFYQTGDIKLDMSAELRFPIIWYLKGAIFIDAANVWTLDYDDSRDNDLTDDDYGTQFQIRDFFRELGIGYGFGMRLDLDYFIIRVDVGFKWHSPYDLDEAGNRFYRRKLLDDGVVQIAVGQSF